MKKILTILLAGVSTLAIAQKKSNLSRSIDDDGKTLSIQVTGTIDGREISFDKSFDVADMSKEERIALRDKILDSIGSGNMQLPEPPKPRTKPCPAIPSPPEPQESMDFSSVEVNADPVYQAKPPVPASVSSDEKGFTKHVKYNPESGEMFLRYRFMKNNEEYIYEKTVDAFEKTEGQRQRIINDFENEIELPGKGIDM
ncbi:hypothetical protein [Dyadobacter sp. CY323]|uniref:hypothetical protein n=1 Tax=Dyadobacter sp. CY323 TaxID=2907302 RepID=UPI001F3C5FE2|nr:hypothetical protein [Dyadobacter sp. CY323]MCE6992674.1 hypothetical protein [Dyadobacter sp. CY323]